MNMSRFDIGLIFETLRSLSNDGVPSTKLPESVSLHLSYPRRTLTVFLGSGRSSRLGGPSAEHGYNTV